MDIQAELDKLIEAKEGNKELALFYDDLGHTPWLLSIGNPSQYVSLGEIEGEFNIAGDTIEECINEMKELLGC